MNGLVKAWMVVYPIIVILAGIANTFVVIVVLGEVSHWWNLL